MNKKYCGVIPPIITPIDAHERVDEDGLRKLLRHCIRVGLHGIFIAGTNGESMAMTQRERERAIAIAIDECADEIPVLCGVMDTGTGRVIENIKRLEQLGGTAAVVTPSFYAKHSDRSEFLRHFEAISRCTACDVFIYNIPPYTGSTLHAADIFEIAQMEHIVGYKDSCGNFSDFTLCLEHFSGSNFVLLQGSSNLAGVSILLGADGMIPSLAPAFPEIYLRVYNSGKQGDVKALRRENAMLYRAQALLSMAKSPLAANKYVLSLLGFSSPRVLLPTQPVTTEEAEQIRLRAIQVAADAGLPARF